MLPPICCISTGFNLIVCDDRLFNEHITEEINILNFINELVRVISFPLTFLVLTFKYCSSWTKGLLLQNWKYQEQQKKI
jgi:hypothetical protein